MNLSLLIELTIRNQIYFRRCPPLCRPHSGGDLCGRDRPGDNRQIPLPEKRDVSKPGSEGSQSGRQPGVPVQQPGRPPEHLQWKPKGVFHLTGCPISWWTGGCRQGGASCQASGLHTALRAAQRLCWLKWLHRTWRAKTEQFTQFCLLLYIMYILMQTGNSAGLTRCWYLFSETVHIQNCTRGSNVCSNL